MKPEASGGAQSADARSTKSEEDAMVVTSEVHIKSANHEFVLFYWCSVLVRCVKEHDTCAHFCASSETSGTGEQSGEDAFQVQGGHEHHG